jgi:protein ImuA
MSTQPPLQSLLHRPDIWRGRDSTGTRRPTALPTGFAALDRALHYGGWPAHGLTELLCDALCPLRLLLPALARTVSEGLVVLANPPALPGAAAWQAAGVPLERLLLLTASQPALLRRACLEAASSDAVTAMLVWLPRQERDPRLLRRLHLAAQQGRCWLVAVRDSQCRQHSSPAPLRLSLTPVQHPDVDVQLEVIKQPGGWAGQQITLAWLPPSLRQPAAPPAQALTPAHMDTHSPRLPAVAPRPEPPQEPPEYRLGLPGKAAAPPVLDLPGRPTGDVPLPVTAPATPRTPPAARRRRRRAVDQEH